MMISFVICVLYNLGDIEATASSPLPIMQVYYQATGSKHATNFLTVGLIVLLFVPMVNILASVSRLIWVFAKDNGLPFSSTLSYVSRLALCQAIPVSRQIKPLHSLP
jgi:choline transport protein